MGDNLRLTLDDLSGALAEIDARSARALAQVEEIAAVLVRETGALRSENARLTERVAGLESAARAAGLESAARGAGLESAARGAGLESAASSETRSPADLRPGTGASTPGTGDQGVAEPPDDPPISRRGAVKALGAALASGAGLGAGASVLLAGPASASGRAAILGVSNTARATTSVRTTSGYGLYGISSASDGVRGTTTRIGASGVRGNDSSGGSGGSGVSGSSANGCAVSGFAGGAQPGSGAPGAYGVYAVSAAGIGVYGETTADDAGGLHGVDNSAKGGHGVVALSKSGDALLASAAGAGRVGVIATSTRGDGMLGETHALTFSGVKGYDAGPGGSGVHGQSELGIGVLAEGGLAPLLLRPSGSPGHPLIGGHSQGELYVDSNGDLYICTLAGSPGLWKRILTAPISTSGPVVTSISPAFGPPAGDTLVTISGTGFVGATKVAFGALDAKSFTVVSATEITAITPAQASDTHDVVVTTPRGISPMLKADLFTYTTLPVITSVAPSSGPTAGGTKVTISGTGFTGATKVAFGVVAAKHFTVVSATEITAVAPPQAKETHNIIVTTPRGTSPKVATDEFTYR